MGYIYYELPESAVPENSYPDGDRVYMLKDEGRGEVVKVYIGVYARKDETPRTFYPNERFRQTYPNLWEERYGTKHLVKHIIGIGTYELTLGIGHKTGLYNCIHQAFGPYYGNLLVDYAMYAIKDRSNAAYLFKPAMDNVFLFSKDRVDDDKLGEVFSKKITHEMIEKFKVEWVQRCVEIGIEQVWLSIDGSNSNFESKGSSLSQKGKAKSRKNVEIVSYIWAVSAEDGLPVTFDVNDGSTSDSKAFDEIITFLKAYGIKVKGVILDKGFLTHPVLQKIIIAGYDFVVNLKDDSHGAKGMISDYGEQIYWNIEHLAGKGGLFGIVSEEPRRIFQRHPETAYIALYFDGKNGSERKVTLTDKIDAEIERLEAQIKNGEKPTVNKEMSRYLSIIEIVDDSLPGNDGKTTGGLDENGSDNPDSQETDGCTPAESEKAAVHATSPGSTSLKSVNSDDSEAEKAESTTAMQSNTLDSHTDNKARKDAPSAAMQDNVSAEAHGQSDVKAVTSSTSQNDPVQSSVREKTYDWVANKKNGKTDLWAKGFSALASSVKMSAREMNAVYHIRDASETQYMICKTMMGFAVFRSHSNEGMETREAICFIAAILRNRFVNSCKERKLKTCRVIEELDNKLYLILNGSGSYDVVNKLSESQIDVLGDVGIQREDISLVAGEVCYRIRKNGVGISQFHDSPDVIRKRNEKQVTVGSQTDSTSAVSNTTQNETGTTENGADNSSTAGSKERRKAGRPPGRKNNKTLEREAAAVKNGNAADGKKRRGRPPGRKNNKTLEREAAERKAENPSEAKRPRGRPVGSKDSKPRKRRTKAEMAEMKEVANQ